MTTQVKAWGNGQGVRFSKELLESSGIHINDYLEISVTKDSIILTKCFKHKTLEERAAEHGGRLGPYSDFAWDDPKGREVW